MKSSGMTCSMTSLATYRRQVNNLSMATIIGNHHSLDTVCYSTFSGLWLNDGSIVLTVVAWVSIVLSISTTTIIVSTTSTVSTESFTTVLCGTFTITTSEAYLLNSTADMRHSWSFTSSISPSPP
ncbi:hypothetical protein HN51_064078 [Arachis hypogaea]